MLLRHYVTASFLFFVSLMLLLRQVTPHHRSFDAAIAAAYATAAAAVTNIAVTLPEMPPYAASLVESAGMSS